MAMSSAGKISSDMFFQAVQSNVEGMSVAMGETLPSKVANIKSAFSRMGAAFLGAGEEGNTVFDRIKQVIDVVLEKARGMIPVVEEIGIKFAEWLESMVAKISEAIDWWKSLDDSQKQLIVSLGSLLIALGPILKILGRVFGVVSKVTGAFNTLASSKIGTAIAAKFAAINAPILAVVAAVGILIAAFASLWKSNEEFRDKIKGIWDQIKDTFKGLVDGISERAESLKAMFDALLVLSKQYGKGLLMY